MVPAAAAPEEPKSLVPKPPPAAEPRLGINAKHGSAGAAQRTIPIRNLTPPPPKKKNLVAKFATMAAVLIVLGVGGYFGYIWLSGMQDKVNTASKEAAKNGDGGQVAHIAGLYDVLDATDPSRAPAEGRTSGPKQRRSGVGQQIPVPNSGDSSAGSTNAADNQPLIPAVWTLDLAKARIPSGRANGVLAGTNFVPETARLDPIGNAQVLRLFQGQPVSPDREVLIYLHLKAGGQI